MRTVGIIVEYNPLHYGHEYHFQQSRAATGADAVIAVMSGHFLQRGEPAIVNKWARTEMALHMGADLVLELPVAYSSQPAEWFAYGAVSALHSTGVVDTLCFGSESGEIGWLSQLADRLYLEPQSFGELVRRHLKSGVSYPAAYGAAVDALASEHGIAGSVSQPNNILGLHYLIALRRLNSSIQPATITRIKAGYHQRDITDRQIASATAIRALLSENKQLAQAEAYMPAYTLQVLRREWEAGRAPVDWERLALPLYHLLVSQPADRLADCYEVTEGLEYRIKKALQQLDRGQPSVTKLLAMLKTKRYTHTKLQRTLLRILLGHRKQQLTAEILNTGVFCLRVLGFSSRGRALLKRMKTTATVPVIAKASQKTGPLLELDIAATAVYALAYDVPSGYDLARDYYEAPIQV